MCVHRPDQSEASGLSTVMLEREENNMLGSVKLSSLCSSSDL